MTSRASGWGFVGVVALGAACSGTTVFGGGPGSGSSTSASGTASGAGGATSTTGGIIVSSATGPATVSSSAGTGGGKPTPENCLNGIDDDLDGATDCADPDCGTYSCIPAAPGADAYVAAVGSAADCPKAAPYAPKTSCAGCSCIAPNGTCSVSGNVYSDAQCQQLISPKTPGCYSLNGFASPRYFTGDASFFAQSQCAPSVPSVPATNAATCELPAGGAGKCGDASKVCVPPVTNLKRQCVRMPANMKCPAPYTQANRGYAGSATSCSCSCNDTGDECGAGYVVGYAGFQCDPNSANKQYPLNGCTDGGTVLSYRFPQFPGKGTCGAAGKPDMALAEELFCCLP